MLVQALMDNPLLNCNLFRSRTENYEYLTPRLNRYVFQASGGTSGQTGGEDEKFDQESYAKEFLSSKS